MRFHGAWLGVVDGVVESSESSVVHMNVGVAALSVCIVHGQATVPRSVLGLCHRLALRLKRLYREVDRAL